MIIVRATVHSMAIPLTVPYTIAYVTITDTVNHFLVLETNDGVCGVGCAAAAPDVTDETPEMSFAALNSIIPLINGRALGDPEYWASIIRSLSNTPSAMTALDMALADMSASAANQSLVEWMGGREGALKAVTTSVTIGISSLQETLDRGRLLIKQGFHFIKVKGGHNVQLDIDRLTILRDELGSEIMLALDANQGYSLQDVEKLDRDASTLKLSYLEQPTPKLDFPLLGLAASATSIPVMADEAVQTEDDAKHIGDLGSVRLINIKLQKMGGFGASSQIDAIAVQAGMRTMLGCMDESALSICAALHFGAAHPNVQFYDLDGHFDLSEDPFESLVTLHAGKLLAPTKPGLGWTKLPPFHY
jgi:L-Ala-D/L-Glu epimerase